MSAERFSGISTEPLRRTAEGIYDGLRAREDPITWRTMAVDMRRVLGSSKPEQFPATAPIEEAKRFVEVMTANTYMARLTPEILYALGYEENICKEMAEEELLDALLISPRHTPDELFWDTADYLSGEDQKIATVIPVGHYSDKELRIIGPRKLFHEVDNLIFLGSTQRMYGGSLNVYAETLNLLRNEEFSSHIKRVSIVMPMFAGSRGHKDGQEPEIGYEVRQAETITTRLSLDVNNVLSELKGYAPKVKFYSVDIHNTDLPKREFERRGFEFESISTEKSFASAVMREVKEQQLHDLPLRLVAVDKSAVARTEKLAAEILKLGANGHNFIDMVEIKKVRNTAGQIESASVEKVVRISLEGDVITKTVVSLDRDELSKEHIRLTSDDMLDSGRSVGADSKLLDGIMPNARIKITVVTHPVMSESVKSALNNTGSDVVIVAKTLTNPELYRDVRLRVVDISEDIARGINSR